MYSACTINGKAVRRLYVNGKLTYTTDPDQMAIANAVAMSGKFGEKTSLGTNSYTYNGQVYNYTVYDAPSVPTWATIGSGNDNPWFASPNIIMCAAHWASSLKTGTWTGSGGKTYNVSSWTNLKTWALSNGWTEDSLKGMSDIGDVVVAVNGSGGTTLAQSDCPWFLPRDILRKAFWNGSLQGTIGYHVPQKSINLGSGDMNIVVPVVMQHNQSWATPKNGYTAIPDRDSATRAKAQSYDNTYLAYVGDSGKPTYIKIGQYDVVVA